MAEFEGGDRISHEDAEIADEFDATGTTIQDTDIVFDCPHCGHNLAIDYRGAGLRITCVNCGEDVLVPIPDGMKIDDLDIEPGEILKQLFATRRNLRKAELRAEDLEARLIEAVEAREQTEARWASLQMQADEMRQLCLQQQVLNGKLAGMVDRLAGMSGKESETSNSATESEANGVQ